MDETQELRIEIRQQQLKFVYYLIALAVTIIGFIVYQTQDKKIEDYHVFLGVAVLLWLISIICGFTFLTKNIVVLQINHHVFQLLKSSKTDFDTTISKMEEMEAVSKNGSKFFTWQQYLFYGGIVIYLFWHIWKMSVIN